MKKTFKVVQVEVGDLPKNKVDELEETIKQKFEDVGVKNIILIPVKHGVGGVFVEEYPF